MMTSVLIIIRITFHNHFKRNFLRKKKLLSKFSLGFLNAHKILNILKKTEPHSFSISEFIDSQERGYLNV